MTEYICKKCKAILLNGRVARDHIRKEHKINKNLKSYYSLNDGKSAIKRLGEKISRKILYK
ncbi:hypothetical protein LCGC14_0732100 [marine sediment metagenome]|uniref:C2H2-type domain-containing protein n=1 Tax=marine sediment metagenome TaxID=412755 RepID=A0A0F9QDE9_9ZZZZ